MSRDASTPQQSWDRVAAGWRRWWETIERPAHAVTERLLALAGIAPGHRVLDIATCIGEPALTAARRVLPDGRVVATDASARMLEIARERAEASALGNVEFLQSDSLHLGFPPESFDAVLCRWGVTSLPAPLATLEGIRRVLAPGRAFATAVWETGRRGRPLASLASALADELFDGAEGGGRTPDRGDSIGASLADDMRRAGFDDVRVEAMTILLDWRSPVDCLQYLLDVSPDLRDRFDAQSAEQQESYGQQLEARLQPYIAADTHVQIANVTLCAVGWRRSEHRVA